MELLCFLIQNYTIVLARQSDTHGGGRTIFSLEQNEICYLTKI